MNTSDSATTAKTTTTQVLNSKNNNDHFAHTINTTVSSILATSIDANFFTTLGKPLNGREAEETSQNVNSTRSSSTATLSSEYKIQTYDSTTATTQLDDTVLTSELPVKATNFYSRLYSVTETTYEYENTSSSLDSAQLRKSAAVSAVPVKQSTPSLVSGTVIDTIPDGGGDSTTSASGYQPNQDSSPPVATIRNLPPPPLMANSSRRLYSNSNSSSPADNLTRPHQPSKEHLQFPGITLKVSHVLIPKQKRSRYNIQTIRMEAPPPPPPIPSSSPAAAASSKNSNCTRFPIQVVTASDTESKEKVNLTEEHYDCEYSSSAVVTTANSTAQQKDSMPLHTYYGGYVFRYALPKVAALNGSVANQSATAVTGAGVRSTTTTAEDNDDYYSSYMEYADSTNGSNNSGKLG